MPVRSSGRKRQRHDGVNMSRKVIIGNEEIDAGTLEANARKLATGLESLGVKEGDVVAVMLRNCEAYLEMINASRQLGSYYCPINWHFKAEEVNYILQDSGSNILVVHAEFWDSLKPVISEDMIVIVADANNIEADKKVRHYARWRDSFDERSVYSGFPRGHMAYTSGTTGKPKGVLRVPFDAEEESERQQEMQAIVQETFGLAPSCRVLLPAPLYHSAPSLFAQFALQASDVFVLSEKFDPIDLLTQIEKYKIEVVYLVPIMYVRLLRLDESIRKKYDISSLRFIASTGAPCPPDVKKAMIDWLGPIVYETYASSETGLITLVNSEQALKKPGTAGRPVGRAVVKIYDNDRQECKQGQIGYIYVRQYAYPDFEYRNNPDARLKVDINGLVNLGDMGYLDEDGYLFVCDRGSDMVISGGVNIYPAEVEAQILQYQGVADCAVFGVPDEEFGESLLACIQPHANTEINVEQIKEWLSTRVAKYKVPRQFQIKRNLPRDDNGKIYKRFLREKYWEGRSRRV